MYRLSQFYGSPDLYHYLSSIASRVIRNGLEKWAGTPERVLDVYMVYFAGSPLGIMDVDFFDKVSRYVSFSIVSPEIDDMAKAVAMVDMSITTDGQIGMRDINRMDKALDEMQAVNMGGTAIGTGINADEAYLRRIVPVLNDVSDMNFIQAYDLIDSTQNLDPFVAVSGAVKACAVTLSKIANDLRLMSSGPRAGFGEINLSAKQNGSSIMPGKVNPVIPEVVNQVAFNVIGNDMTITLAAEAGQLELNAFEPIIFYNLFQSIDTLGYAVETFVDNCVSGITANEERCRYLVESSVGVITALAPHMGYQKSADIAKKALKTGKSVRDIILEDGVLTEAEMNEILDPVHMTEPGISGKELLNKKAK